MNVFYQIFILTAYLTAHAFCGAPKKFDAYFGPVEWSVVGNELNLKFRAFGRSFDLNLVRNDKILAERFEIWENEKNVTTGADLKNSIKYYVSENSSYIASFNILNKKLHGLIILDNALLEIDPADNSSDYYSMTLHNNQNLRSTSSNRRRRSSPTTLTLELAIFLDSTAYSKFSLFFDDANITDLLLAYVSNIQALYLHPSLGVRLEIRLVRLEILKIPDRVLQLGDGERYEVLDQFCRYSSVRNPQGDQDPRHWDLGLLLTGLDLYNKLPDNRRDYLTMGLSSVGGVCMEKYSCVITEFGVSDPDGRPYPSAGFTSAYVAAHEIGHSLGMLHDSSGNSCSKDGYIMSPSRATRGESHWSRCSQEIASKLPTTKLCLLDDSVSVEKSSQLDSNVDNQEFINLNHRKRYKESPGRYWNARKQCELLMKDPVNAQDLPSVYYDSKKKENPCWSLKCWDERNKTYFYAAGPALDGTDCGLGKECRSGECLAVV